MSDCLLGHDLENGDSLFPSRDGTYDGTKLWRVAPLAWMLPLMAMTVPVVEPC